MNAGASGESLPPPAIITGSMIAVSDLGKSFGPQTLFEGVSIQFNPGNRYGLVGANGSGKSTFLRILAGEELPSDGTIAMPKRLKLGVLKQDHFRYEHMPILEVAMMGNHDVWEAMVEKERLLADAEQEFDADRYAELEDLILRNDGYTLEARAGEVLEGLGIPTEVHRQPLSTLSGGFKLRVLLAQVLAADPDVLLLDEPTNHLDILSIRWLEKFLVDSYKGTALVISHDHRFLDNICTHIVDVDYETIIALPRQLHRLHGGQGGRAGPQGSRDREARGRDRPPQGVRRPLPRQGHQGAAGAEQDQADREDRHRAPAAELAALSHLQVPAGPPQRPAGAGARGDLQVLRRQAGAGGRLAAQSSAATASPSSVPTASASRPC